MLIRKGSSRYIPRRFMPGNINGTIPAFGAGGLASNPKDSFPSGPPPTFPALQYALALSNNWKGWTVNKGNASGETLAAATADGMIYWQIERTLPQNVNVSQVLLSYNWNNQGVAPYLLCDAYLDSILVITNRTELVSGSNTGVISFIPHDALCNKLVISGIASTTTTAGPTLTLSNIVLEDRTGAASLRDAGFGISTTLGSFVAYDWNWWYNTGQSLGVSDWSVPSTETFPPGSSQIYGDASASYRFQINQFLDPPKDYINGNGYTTGHIGVGGQHTVNNWGLNLKRYIIYASSGTAADSKLWVYRNSAWEYAADVGGLAPGTDLNPFPASLNLSNVTQFAIFNYSDASSYMSRVRLEFN